MKTNLKLSKITISKLDNFNSESIKDQQLKNLKGGEEAEIWTIEIITIGSGPNITHRLTSCAIGDYTECMSRDS